MVNYKALTSITVVLLNVEYHLRTKSDMTIPHSLDEFKEMLSKAFNRYDPDIFNNIALKAYLIESNLDIPPQVDGYTPWNNIGGTWHVCNNTDNYLVLNKGSGRIWTIFTLQSVNSSDDVIENWTKKTGLDRCWFSGDYLSKFGRSHSWIERGLGLKYNNSLAPGDEGMRFSMKAWHGTDMDSDLSKLFELAKKKFTTTSIRWKSLRDDNLNMSSEWYNNGKITIQYAESVNELLGCISDLTMSYKKSLLWAEKCRNDNRSSFEFTFEREISLDDYSDALLSGKNSLKLWMIETDNRGDYRSYSGIDLHTGDRILLDMGKDYAYMSIPGNGCVNATPRFVAINGENALGRVKAYYEGCEIFDGSQI